MLRSSFFRSLGGGLAFGMLWLGSANAGAQPAGAASAPATSPPLLQPGPAPIAPAQPPFVSSGPLSRAAMWQPGDPVPPGYRVKYQRSRGLLIAGAATLSLSYTVSTLMAIGFGVTGPTAAIIAPMGAIPVVGPFPIAAFSAIFDAGAGTVASLIGLGLTQGLGLGLLIGGLKKREPAHLVPDCETSTLHISPMVSPTTAGLAIGGTL